ncbi:acyl carrier protein [Micromonospora sp. DT229]|uniref:acyl carrier protein n=1 Tax=Micromonospora sp. DT229 TaxID=3393430 RepID=UPI003CF72695
MPTTLEKVSEIFLEEAPEVEVVIGPNLRFSQDLGIDSLTFVDILVKIEKVFEVEFSDNELASMQSVQDILDLVEKKTV